jgi:two-component system, OmpR family, sensor kinase
MLARNSESFERERRFVADASHEIRTPLAVIRTELETALLAGQLPSETRSALTAAHAECLRLVRLADDLLVLARVADGHLPLRLCDVELRSAVTSVRDLYADNAAEQGRFIAIDIPPDLVVRADPDRLRQLITNLMDNALRHGSGVITASAQPVVDGAELTILDQGPGLSAEFADRAFERFSRGESFRPREGAGLGLSLVSTIAHAHGGRAWVTTSTPRTVRVWLPGA